MMIRIGYPRHFAGAVKSTAAGGQITPPIMGAAAFLMVEYLALPYQTIILAAIVPAFMHFFGVFCQVHFEAKKLGMRGMTADELPRISEVVRRDWPTSVPLFVLLIVLFSGFTALSGCVLGHHGVHRARPHQPQPDYRRHRAGGCGHRRRLSASSLEWLRLRPPSSPPVSPSAPTMCFGTRNGRTRLIDLVDAFVMGAKYAISVGAAAATVGIIVGVVTLAGVANSEPSSLARLAIWRPSRAPSCRPCCSTRG